MTLRNPPRSLAGGRTPRPPGGDATERRSLRDVGAAGLARASTPVGEGRMAPETAAARGRRPMDFRGRAQAHGAGDGLGLCPAG